MDLERSLVSQYVQREWKIYYWLSSTPLPHLKLWLLMVFPAPTALDLRWSLYVRLWRRRGRRHSRTLLIPPLETCSLFQSVSFPLPSPSTLPLLSCLCSPLLWELTPASPLRWWCSVTKSCLTLCDPMDCSTPHFCPSLSPGVCAD